MSAPERVDIQQKMESFHEYWRPKIVAELNGQEVKVVKLLGEFPWHSHADIDELFVGWRGHFRMEFRDSTVEIAPGQMIVVPRGVEHRPVADQEAQILLIEPAGVRNTGDANTSDYTAPDAVRI